MRRPSPVAVIGSLVGALVSALTLSVTGPAPAARANPLDDLVSLVPHLVGTLLGGKQPVGEQATPVFPAYRQNPRNPLAGRTMGVYMGRGEMAWEPFATASRDRRELLGRIALRPKARWFGAWIADEDIGDVVRGYIENSQEGDPEVLVQMTVFRMDPWYTDACHTLPTRAQQRSYRIWIRRFAAAVGRTPAAIVLQPDLPFVLCFPDGGRIASRQVRYAARVLSALPRTAVYLDVGAADWPKDDPRSAASMLVRAGVSYARGFALNATHYVPTSWDVRHGTKVVAELARRGLPGKRFVVNTSSNGRGFEFGLARGAHPDHANVCRTRTERHCVTLGIPPTTAVAAKRWGLPRDVRRKARRHVDAYLWFGRPWLVMQAAPFDLPRALDLARTTPW